MSLNTHLQNPFVRLHSTSSYGMPEFIYISPAVTLLGCFLFVFTLLLSIAMSNTQYPMLILSQLALIE